MENQKRNVSITINRNSDIEATLKQIQTQKANIIDLEFSFITFDKKLTNEVIDAVTQCKQNIGNNNNESVKILKLGWCMEPDNRNHNNKPNIDQLISYLMKLDFF